MRQGYAARPTLLRSAFKHLFSAAKSDWREVRTDLRRVLARASALRSRSMTFGSTKPPTARR